MSKPEADTNVKRKKRSIGSKINWDGHVIRIFKSVASDQCMLKKTSLKVLSSMLDDMILRLGAESATLCKIKQQRTMQPSTISRAITLVCRRSELSNIMISDAHKTLRRFNPDLDS